VESIGVRGDAMVESAGNVRYEDVGRALAARRIIQGWSATWRLPHVDQLVRRCLGADGTSALSGATGVHVMRPAGL
jgi:hypothetical protein